MAGKPTLEQLLANVSQQYLDKPCEDDHLHKIYCDICDWKVVAVHLKLKEVDVEVVEHSGGLQVQRIKLLKMWKQHFGQNATYQKLAEAFFAAGRVDLVGKIQVDCTHVEEGCKWTLELKDLKQHLNATPKLGKELDGCEYAEVSCAHGCNRRVKRHSLHEHMKECLLQPKEEIISKHQQEIANKPKHGTPRNDITKLRRYAIFAAIIVALFAKIIYDHKDLEYQLHQRTALDPSKCTAEGPGLYSPIVNKTSEFTVSLVNVRGWAYRKKGASVTAELESEEYSSITRANVSYVPETSRYRVIYSPRVHGWSKLHVKVNNRHIKGSPFRLMVQKTKYPSYPEVPQRIGGRDGHWGPEDRDHWGPGVPEMMGEELSRPWGIAINSYRDIYVTEFYGHQISVFDADVEKIQTIGSEEDEGRLLWFPTGIDIDKDDNVYVVSDHKLQKFDSSGERVGNVASNNTMRGVRVHNDKVYVCDQHNHRILMYDLELTFIGQFIIGSNNRTHNITRNGTFDVNEPLDIAFDAEGNAYVVDSINHRIQVLNETGHFLRHIGEEKLSKPRGIHISGNYVYVSDKSKVVLFRTSGKFETTIGEDILNEPVGITTDSNGIYVCDTYEQHIFVIDFDSILHS